jgi:hypothetical protein
MPEIPLDARVDDAFTPSERDNTHLAALDIRHAALDIRQALTAQLRRLLGDTTDFS